MLYRYTTISIAVLLNMAVNVHISLAQSEDMLAVHPYENFGFIGKMRLSAAYFVNPTLADQAEVGYFIPFSDLDDNKRKQVEQLIQDGEANVSVMTSDGKFYKLVDPEWNLSLGNRARTWV